MDHIEKILRLFAQDVMLHARHLIGTAANTKTGTNTMAGSSLQHDLSYDVTGDEIGIIFNHYIVYVEWDRPPKYGYPPPYKAILAWLKKKNIPPTNFAVKTVEQAAWKVRQSIWKKGWDGRLIAGFDGRESPLDKYADEVFERKFADMLADALLNDIDNFFKD